MLKFISKIIFLAMSIIVIMWFTYVYALDVKKKVKSYVYKCSDFKSQVDAQKAYDTGKKEYSRLDGGGKHKNNRACDSYKYESLK